MNESKKSISNAQKISQKKYDQKTKMISVKYTPANMDEYERLKVYLNETGQSTNNFIKSLINNFFESGQDQENFNHTEKAPVIEKNNGKKYYDPYSWISDDSIRFLQDSFGEDIMNKVLHEYSENIEFDIDNMLEDKGCNFDDWIEELKNRINDGEFQKASKEEMCKELIADLNNTV